MVNIHLRIKIALNFGVIVAKVHGFGESRSSVEIPLFFSFFINHDGLGCSRLLCEHLAHMEF